MYQFMTKNGKAKETGWISATPVQGSKRSWVNHGDFRSAKLVSTIIVQTLLYQQTSMLVEQFSAERPKAVPLA